MSKHPVLLTKINPPRISARALERPRVTAALMDALQYRLTVIQAGAGYGKSTAVLSLVERHRPLIWYQISREDGDPFVFLQHLLHATQLAIPELDGLPIPFLESWDSSRGPLPAREVLYRYLNELSEGLQRPTILVLEDLHLAAQVPEISEVLDQLVSLAPHTLHLIFTTRTPLDLPGTSRWLARGQMLQIDQALLAFTPGEVAQFFQHRHNYLLSEDELAFLVDTTEGWAITLQMVGQSLGKKTITNVRQALDLPSASLDNLFDILAQEVLALQPDDIQQFMRITSTLQEMTPEACDSLPGIQDSQLMLETLHHQDLFVLKIVDDLYRYHHIFHRFLRQQSEAADRREWHNQAAKYFREIGDHGQAFYHALKAGDDLTGASLLTQYGEELLRQGRLTTLKEMLDSLKPETLQKHPTLLFMLGELARMHSRFQEALGWYEQALALWREGGQMDGISRALRGQARVYLDTLNPSKAEELLQEALRLSDGTSDRDTMANLYELLAENRLNAGKGEEAEAFRRKAQVMRQEGPPDSQLLMRVLLRTGRLAEARAQLEQLAELERAEPVQKPRAHRETHLLLSFIYAMLGEAQAAYESALEGTQRGENLGSPYVTAVGYIREAHSLMLLSKTMRYQKALERFDQAIELSRSLHISRLRIEAYWGLTRAYGYRGDLDEARRMAEKGIEMANAVGDEWINSLIRCTMGASYIIAGDYEKGHEQLAQSTLGFQECSDPFGQTCARLWRCVGWFYAGDLDQFSGTFKLVLESSLRHDFGSLLTKRSLLGVPDERRLVPLLLRARKAHWLDNYPDRLLDEMGLSKVLLHPGYQLVIETLGSFTVSRGDTRITASEWKREKSRQLLQVLIANRAAPFDRDQICECLWPGMQPETSHRNFKVALSTLYQVLEPEREPGSDSAYIVREGSTYALRPGADIWLDAVEVDEAIRASDENLPDDPQKARARLDQVLDLYKGDFLPDTRYETWTAAERERLTVQFLRSCDRLCEWNLDSDPETVISICQRVLAADNCWERAYRFMMKAYSQLGDHGQVARTFQTCLDILQSELDVAPASQTFELYQSLIETRR